MSLDTSEKKIEYIYQGGVSKLVYHVAPGEQLDMVTWEMLNRNRIPGLLSPVFSQVDTDVSFGYQLTGCSALGLIMQGKVPFRRLVQVFGGIAEAMATAEDYLIPQKAFLLDVDYIFWEQAAEAVRLVCLPVLQAGEEPSLCGFFRDVLSGVMVDAMGAGEAYSELQNYLTLHLRERQPLPLAELRRYLGELAGKLPEKQGGSAAQAARGPQPAQQPVVPPQPVAAPAAPPQPPVIPPEPRDAQRKKPGGLMGWLQGAQAPKAAKDGKTPKPAREPKAPKSDYKKPGPALEMAVPGMENAAPEPVLRPQPAAEPAWHVQDALKFGHTINMEAVQSRGTVVLDTRKAAAGFQPKLVRKTTGVSYPVTGSPFRIGHSREATELCVDNPAVSALHAYLRISGEQCQLLDANSLNHSYLNGEELSSNSPYPLQNGDRILLANEEFTYYDR